MTPVDLSEPEVVFGPDGGIEKLLPPMASLPEDFRRERNEWCREVQRWFFGGASKERVASLVAKPGVDKAKALRHVKAALGSFEPKHEHKIAGCGYLMSLWFEPLDGKPASP